MKAGRARLKGWERSNEGSGLRDRRLWELKLRVAKRERAVASIQGWVRGAQPWGSIDSKSVSGTMPSHSRGSRPRTFRANERSRCSSERTWRLRERPERTTPRSKRVRQSSNRYRWKSERFIEHARHAHPRSQRLGESAKRSRERSWRVIAGSRTLRVHLGTNLVGAVPLSNIRVPRVNSPFAQELENSPRVSTAPVDTRR